LTFLNAIKTENNNRLKQNTQNITVNQNVERIDGISLKEK